MLLLSLSACAGNYKFQSYQCDKNPDIVYIIGFNNKQAKLSQSTSKIHFDMKPIPYVGDGKYSTPPFDDAAKETIRKNMWNTESGPLRFQNNPHREELIKKYKEAHEIELDTTRRQQLREEYYEMLELYPNPPLTREQEELISKKIDETISQREKIKPIIIQKNSDETITFSDGNGRVQICSLIKREK